MNYRKLAIPFMAVALAFCFFCASAFADTIRLKNGTVIRGEVVGFQDQQFIVLIGDGTRGRRSRMMLYMEDVESIEFEGRTSSQTAVTTAPNNRDTGTSTAPTTSSTPETSAAQSTSQTTNSGIDNNDNRPAASQPTSTPSRYQVNVRVRADNTTNGWTNTGLVVRRGQRLRISATGRVALGAGRSSTPAGLATTPDTGKLMRNEPTGALIAVIGNDNDDFILIGNAREFVVQRDGVLFLGVNEGDLNDNTGNYDATIETEGVSGTSR